MQCLITEVEQGAKLKRVPANSCQLTKQQDTNLLLSIGHKNLPLKPTWPPKTYKAEVNDMVTCLKSKMDTILNRISQVESNLDAKLSGLATRVITVEGSIEKVTKNLQSTILVANDAHFEARKLNDKLALQGKLTKALEATVDDLHGRLRRNTLVFHTIPEATEETASGVAARS